MPEINKSNREVCDVYLCDLKTRKPFLYFDTANTTTVGLTGDAVYAMAKGARRIAFANPMSGSLQINAMVYPYKFFAMFSDGVYENSAIYADKQTVECSKAGELTLVVPKNGTIQVGTVFAYPDGSLGDDTAMIDGTYAEGKFTAASEKIVAGSKYVVGYLVNRTGVRKISFTNKKYPKDYFITMSTLDKDENGIMTPFRIVVYKATPQRNFELTFNSEGDPATVTMTLDILEDKDGNILDFIELSEDATGN